MSNIPAGLTDNNIEVFTHKNKLLALSNGNAINYFDLPEILRRPFINEMHNDKEALHCLKQSFKLKSQIAQEYKFVKCRYGALDSTPDCSNEQLIADAPFCDKIKTCPGFNIVCKVPPGPNGVLSRSEFMVAKYVGQGKQDIEIADHLAIKTPTVRTHLSRIREKLKLNNRNEVSLWIQGFGIL